MTFTQVIDRLKKLALGAFGLLPAPARRALVRALFVVSRRLKVVLHFLRALFDYKVDDRERVSSQLLYATTGIFAVFLLWAYVVELDQVVTAQAKIFPFSRLQSVEHYEGGRVEKIHVRQGDIVKEGDLLVSLSPLQTKGDLNVQRDSFVRLSVRSQRLRAEVERSPRLVLDPALRAESPEVVAQEEELFKKRVGRRASELSGKRSQVLAAESRVRAAEVGAKASDVEMAATVQLVNRGLEPSLSLARAQKGNADSRAALEGARQDYIRLQSEYNAMAEEQMAEVMSEWTKAQSDLVAARESLLVAADRADRSEMRAPINGVVNRVLISTEGGTVKPGESVVEIVPADSTIVVEANVQPADIGFIGVGQTGLVKITAYDFSVFGALEGEVQVITADTITDEAGNQFYVVKLALKNSYLETSQRKLRIIPGMQAQVDIVVGKRSALEYVFSPITKAFKESLREK